MFLLQLVPDTVLKPSSAGTLLIWETWIDRQPPCFLCIQISHSPQEKSFTKTLFSNYKNFSTRTKKAMWKELEHERGSYLSLSCRRLR